MAPVLFSEDAKPSAEADMYAFGMVVYEVITGARPYGQRMLTETEISALTVQTGGSNAYRVWPRDMGICGTMLG